MDIVRRVTPGLLLCAAACGGGPAPRTGPAIAGTTTDSAFGEVWSVDTTSPASVGAAANGSRVIRNRDWAGQGATRLEDVLVGRVPGVQVLTTPRGFAVQIRGATSILGSNQPLYIVDGVPFDASQDGLVAIPPSDVARIEVLKDAASTAQYGVRGGNGVVIITTKRAP